MEKKLVSNDSEMSNSEREMAKISQLIIKTKPKNHGLHESCKKNME